MTIQLELPLFPTTREPCPVISAGQSCRFYADHANDCSFGGGLKDPIEARHCPRNNRHEPHAWPQDKPAHACSGLLVPVFCDNDQRIHLPHDNCPGRDHARCDLSEQGEIHVPHGYEDRKHSWWCLGQAFCGVTAPHAWHVVCPGREAA